MFDKIIKLPKWCVLGTLPAFYDTDSVTATEQTARVYAKMNELVDSYNAYVEQFNKHIEEYEGEHNQALSDFICQINCLCDKFINTVDMKIDHQNRMIDEVYKKFANDILNTTQTLLNELKEAGEIDNAILTALDNANVKIDNFITEVNGKQADLEQDYNSVKGSLEYDYQQTKTNLEQDYQSTKDSLEGDYQITKQQINNYVNEVLYQTEEKISGVDLELFTGLIPYGSNQNVNIGEIYKCKLVYVDLNDGEAHCTANVIVAGNTFNIVGIGISNETSADTTYLGAVNIHGTIDGNVCKIVNNSSVTFSLSNGFEMVEGPINSIKGII